MTNGFLNFAGLALALAVLASSAVGDCDFQPDCRPGETYFLAIPCEGKCSSYVQCTNGAAAEKKCGKYFFVTKSFDPVKLECVRDTIDCDWWKKISTTTAAPTPTTTPAAVTTTPAPETTPSTSTTSSTEVPPATSTEASSTTPASDTTVQPPSTPSTPSPPAPEPEPEPAGSAAAAPLAAVWATMLSAAVALAL